MKFKSIINKIKTLFGILDHREYTSPPPIDHHWSCNSLMQQYECKKCGAVITFQETGLPPGSIFPVQILDYISTKRCK